MDPRRFRAPLFSLALALALFFPVSVPAITENSLESAPPVTLPEITEEADTAESTAEPIPYLPYDQWLPDRSVYLTESEEYLLPRLTNGELERIRGIRSALEEGRDLSLKDLGFAGRTGKVNVGVYPLDPQDFNGETFYVLLPASPLSDDDLFSLISAFDRLGISFDPDSLNERNCTRGVGAVSATRGLSYEESVRMKTIRYQLHRGIIVPDRIPAGTYCSYADTDWRDSPEDVNGTYRFCFYPYRSMTDEELTAFAFAAEGAWDVDPDLVEKQALDAARRLLNVPLSLAADNEEMSRWKDGTRCYDSTLLIHYIDERTGEEICSAGEPYECFVVQQQAPDSGQITLNFVDLWFYSDEPASDRSSWPEYSEEEWIALARERAKEILRLPEEQLPAEWKTDPTDAEDRRIGLSARNDSLYVSIVLNRWDAGIFSVLVAPDPW